MQHGDGALPHGLDFVIGIHRHVEIPYDAVGDTIDPPVNREILAAIPCRFDDGGLANVDDLLHDVQFTKARAFCFFAFQRGEVIPVLIFDVLNVAQPIVDQSNPQVEQRRDDAPTTIVTTNDDVFDL